MAWAIAGGVLGLTGCAGASKRPDIGLIYSETAQRIGADRVPVVVIPGILGSKLADGETGTDVWGFFIYGAADADTPEGARLVALPMAKGVPLSELRDGVSATEALDTLTIDTLGFIRGVEVEAYAGILRTLGTGRYRDETLGRAGAVDYGGLHWTCFQSAYDWRRDIAEGAATLGERIHFAQATARQAHGLSAAAPVRVDVVAHSMGGLVLRYYLRYGEQPLPEDGSLPALTWAGAEHVRRAVLVGTPNAGAVLAVRQLVEGKNLNPVGPNYRPGVLGTMPSIYQLLPRPRHGRVIDLATGASVDLYDSATWRRYGWGLAGPMADRQLEWLLPEMNADERRALALEQLEKCLARAEQLHRALDVPASPPEGTEILLFAGDTEATPDVLGVEADGTIRVVSEGPGDGTVTRASALMDERVGQAWHARLRGPADWDRVQFLQGSHLGMTNDAVFVDNLLFLLLEAPSPGEGW